MRKFIKVKSEIRTVGNGQKKKEVNVIYPDFMINGKDIMRKGGNFYAILDPDTGMWSTNQNDVYRIIDEELYSYAESHFKEDGFGIRRDNNGNEVIIKTINDSSTRVLIDFNKWFNNLEPNHNYKPLDSDLTFLSDEVTPDMYRSKRLPYDLADGDIPAYDKIMGTLYAPVDREKIEWSIGAILSGDSKKIEKFVVLYGTGGTGKSTILDMIQKIFEGYWSVFVAEELALKSHQFATASFKDNPLIAIQDDGSLAKIDSPRINEIVSHKPLQINEKNTKQYTLKPQAMLFLATNDKVDMHDTNLGITRRLLDVYPTGQLIPVVEYRKLVHQMMNFEIPMIASHCLKVYSKLGKEYYAKYVPHKMIKKTNYIYNFLFDKCEEFVKDDPITRDALYLKFKEYCNDSGFMYVPKRNDFCDQIKPYYKKYTEVGWYKGSSHRHVFSGFRAKLFMDTYKVDDDKQELLKEEDNSADTLDTLDTWLTFESTKSIFDDWCKDKGFKAQYDTRNKVWPIKAWSKVNTTMKNIDSTKLHWINIPVEEKHIRIDFDLKNDSGEKDLAKNIEAASVFPPTYAEISQSGGGIHLHYFYDGDVLELANELDEDIEIKTDKGDGGCRRKLTKCNDIPMATLHKGQLKLKERSEDMVPTIELQNEKHLRNKIARCLTKKSAGSTSQCVSLIKQHLDDAYHSNVSYDLSDMEDDIFKFAMNSTNNSERCMKLVDEMHLRSKDIEDRESHSEVNGFGETDEKKPLVFFDIEVFPNVFMICWKYAGADKKVTKLINPPPSMIKDLFDNNRMVGFNNRDYDNHICWYYMQGYTPYMCYDISNRIINKKDQSAKAWQAYGLSYTDVYDLASNPHKMSLKKWQIKLKMHHQENSYPWDEDLDESKWDEVAEYCVNDVLSTEAVYDHIKGDVVARILLSKLSGLTPNDKTNKHSMQIIFGDDEHPQTEFIYTDLSKLFPGYKFDPTAKVNKSTYKGYSVGEGGFVWAKPGMYRHVVTFDVASMHPSSLIAMNMFGDKYTKRFKEIKDARLAVKHKDREALKTLLGGQLLEFYDIAVYGVEYTLGDLATALKTVINSVYGLTAAKFDNRCRDPRNIDNIVAKRGALFMINLKEEVEKRGGLAVHFKTDSIKVVNPTKELEEFIVSYGKEYGYEFEVESVYDRFCLVNDAVYIAKYEDGTHEFELSTGEKIVTDWAATGAEFAHPYIFKKLFSGDEINTDDMSETKNAEKGALYLDFNESLSENEHDYRFVGKVSSFVPVKPGCDGAKLVVKRDTDKYDSVSGTKDYRWLEAEYIKNNHRENDIDMNYYENLVNSAINHINEFGNFDRFVNDPDYDPILEKIVSIPNEVNDDEIPFDSPYISTPVA